MTRRPVIAAVAAAAAASLAALTASVVVPMTAVGAEVSRASARPTISERLVLSRTGVMLAVLSHRGDAWTVRTPCGGSARLTVVERVVQPTVVLDPGHGGDELGAQGASGLLEKELNLSVARHAQRALEAAGLPTVLTRTADYRVPLEVRGGVVAAGGPRAFVSIHHNSNADGPLDGPGSEMYYQHESAQSRRLAGLVYEEVVRALRKYPVAWQGERDAGVKTRLNSRGGDYYGIVRRGGRVPTALAELAFVSNPAEEAVLRTAEVQRAEGEAVARGIVRFLTTKDPGSGYVDAYPRSEPAGPGGGFGGCVDPPLE